MKEAVSTETDFQSVLLMREAADVKTDIQKSALLLVLKVMTVTAALL